MIVTSSTVNKILKKGHKVPVFQPEAEIKA